MTSPRVSIVMCCYNAAKYIKESINSILNQSFNDFEFIIWDDGSSDNTKDIINSYSDRRIKYFYHANTGLGQALKMACEKAVAPIIARMDSDDISLPMRLEKEYDYLMKHDDVVLVSSAVNYINDKGDIMGSSFPYTNYTIISRIMKTGGSVIVHPSAMFRKSDYIKAGGYYPLKKAQDSLLFSKMMKYGKLAVISDVLLNYRISSNSISSQTQMSDYDSLIILLRKKMINDNNVNPDDVVIYNKMVELAKEQNKNKTDYITSKRIKSNLENVLYSFLTLVLGNTKSRNLIICVKNWLALLFKRY